MSGSAPGRRQRRGYRGTGWRGLLVSVGLLGVAAIAGGTGTATSSPAGTAPVEGAAPFEGTAPFEGAGAHHGPGELRARTTSCELCAPEEGVRVVDLGEAGLESLGRRMTAANDSAWDRADRVFQTGGFGDPGTENARTKTLTHFLLRSRNALHYLAELGGDSVVHRFAEADLENPFGVRYANTTVFPIRFLEQGFIGNGGFCLRYQLGSPIDQRVMLGGVPVRIRSDVTYVDDAADAKPSLSVAFSSEIHKTIELLFLSDVCGRVRRETIVDRGDTLELITVTDIEGMYARRAGTHRLGALVFWRSLTTGERDPERPRAGACAYFPHISLNMPFFLPDLGLDDLREFDLPNPVVSVEWAHAHPGKPWVSVSPDVFFSPWEAIGPRPEEVVRRFPDL